MSFLILPLLDARGEYSIRCVCFSHCTDLFRIRTLAPSTISSIDWETLADTHFPGMGATVLSKMFKKMMGKTQATLSTPLSGDFFFCFSLSMS